jgi:DNA-binding transcriptional LysR family regulator
MELRHLRYFQAVAEELHFSRAAERLHISQPPLSMQIKDLEEELEVRLLERTRRQVRLTRCGQTFLRRVRSVLSEIESAVEEARCIDRGEVDRVSVGYKSAFMLQTIAPRLNQFQRLYPNVELRLKQAETPDQYDAVHDHRIDVGFVDAPIIARASDSADTTDLAGTKVLSLRLVMALPVKHPLANRKRVRLNEFARDDFVMNERQSVPTVYDLQIGLCQRAGFSPRIRVHTSQLPETLAFVAAGYGVSFATEAQIGSWPELISFVKLEETAYVTIFAIYRPDNGSKAVRNFCELLSNPAD